MKDYAMPLKTTKINTPVPYSDSGQWSNISANDPNVTTCVNLVIQSTASSLINGDRSVSGFTQKALDAVNANLSRNRGTLWLWQSTDTDPQQNVTIAFHATDGGLNFGPEFRVCAGIDENIDTDDAFALFEGVSASSRRTAPPHSRVFPQSVYGYRREADRTRKIESGIFSIPQPPPTVSRRFGSLLPEGAGKTSLTRRGRSNCKPLKL